MLKLHIFLGSDHLEAFCFNNVGRKKQWINQEDVILVVLRDYQDDKTDVIMRYLADEVRESKRICGLSDNVNITKISIFISEGLEDIIFDERYSNDDAGNND